MTKPILTPPPLKNPNGRRTAGGTLVMYVDRDPTGAPVPYARDSAGRPLWKWVFRYRGPKQNRFPARHKNLACADWRDAESEALKLIGQWTAEAGAPRERVSDSLKPPAAWRFSELVEHYLESTAKRGREAQRITREITPYFVVTLGDPPIDQVTTRQCRAWSDQYVEADGMSASTQKKRLDQLKQLFGYAMDEGQIVKCPARDLSVKVKRVSDGGDQREHHPLTDAELGKLVGWLTEHAPPPATFAVRLVAAIGLRDQEATHLRLQDVYLDVAAPYVHLVNFACSCGYCTTNRGGKRKTKSGRERMVPLPPELLKPFRAYLAARASQVPASSKWVFPVWSAARCRNRKPGDQLDRSWLNEWLQRAVKEVGPVYDPERKQLVFHTLRSKADTDLGSRSKDMIAVMCALGHKLHGETERYNTLREQVGKLAAALYPDAYPDDLAKRRKAKAKAS